MNRSFDALIVDFGGVLTTPLNDAMAVFAEEHGIELQDLVRAALRAYTGLEDNLVPAFETGEIPEHEFALGFAARLEEESGVPVEPEGLIDRIFATLLPEEAMYTAVARAHASGLKTGLCSNSWGMGLYPKHRFEDLFDVVVISGEVGMRKPDAEIFEFTLKQLEVDAPRAIFVDDHPGHLKTASDLGMQTVLHRTATETILELEELLEIELGVE
jgi:putative hydrolase of the HAD superfamily